MCSLFSVGFENPEHEFRRTIFNSHGGPGRTGEKRLAIAKRFSQAMFMSAKKGNRRRKFGTSIPTYLQFQQLQPLYPRA